MPNAAPAGPAYFMASDRRFIVAGLDAIAPANRSATPVASSAPSCHIAIAAVIASVASLVSDWVAPANFRDGSKADSSISAEAMPDEPRAYIASAACEVVNAVCAAAARVALDTRTNSSPISPVTDLTFAIDCSKDAPTLMTSFIPSITPPIGPNAAHIEAT